MLRTFGRRIRHDTALLVEYIKNDNISMIFNGLDVSTRNALDGTAKQVGCRRLQSGDAMRRMESSDGGVDPVMQGKMPFKIDDMDSMVRSVSQEDLEELWYLKGLNGCSKLNNESDGMDQMDAELQKYSALESLRLYTLAFRHHLEPWNHKTRTYEHKYRLVELYAKSGLLKVSLEYLEAISATTKRIRPRTKTWDRLMEASKQFRQPLHAKKIFKMIQHLEARPSKKLLRLLMNVYAENHMMEEALSVIDIMREYGMHVDEHTYATAIKACTRNADLEKASRIFRSMKEEKRDIPHRVWSLLIMAHAASRDAVGAVKVSQEMKSHGISLNARDYTGLLRSFRESEDIPGGMALLGEIQQRAIEPDVSLMTEIIRLHTARGDIKKAVDCFWSLDRQGLQPDRGAFNIVIDALMNSWVDSNCRKDSPYLSEASTIFDMGWDRKIFLGPGESSHSRVSQKGFTNHADLHRTGLWACQFAIIKHFDIMYDTFRKKRKTLALKLISGKGKGYRHNSHHMDQFMSLVDIVRAFLGKSNIYYFEDNIGVFSIPKSSLHRLFLIWNQKGFICSPKSFSQKFVDPRL